MKRLYSSYSDHWATPDSLYRKLEEEFLFTFDPCPLHHAFDGLSIEWGERNYVNPPYSAIEAWLKKAIEQLELGRMSVFLLPARTGMAWFHEYVLPYATDIRFLRGRVKFGNSGKSAPFDSMIVIFDREACDQ